jgi:hypothetical protein
MLEEGILCGGSCGAAMHYAIKYAQVSIQFILGTRTR